MKCKDCNGTGRYVSCFEDEPCQRCEGSGLESKKITTEKSKGTKYVIDEISFVNDSENPCGEIKLGDIVHVYKTCWFNAIVCHFERSCQTIITEYMTINGMMMRFEIKLQEITWNLTQGRWEHIYHGVPTHP